MKANSKYENLMALRTVINASEDIDGVLLIVSGVIIVGKLNIQTEEIETPTSLYETTNFWKNRINDKYDDVEWFGDGAVVGISDATIRYPDGTSVTANDLVVLVSEIDAFTAVNIQEYLK
ncbi:MAG: hypothetical protein RR565_04880 [Erysipelothrix sp.]|jgi:hypothetical protein